MSTLAADIRIRQATKDDVPALGRLGASLMRLHYAFDTQRFLAPSGNPEEGYGRFLGSQLRDVDATVFVADRAGEVVGYVYAGLEPLLAPKGATSLLQPLTFARIHQYISIAVPMLWLRQHDAIGALGLAVNTSRERDNGHPESSEQIQELLVTAHELWRDGAELAAGDARVATFRSAIQLVNLADLVTITTRA